MNLESLLAHVRDDLEQGKPKYILGEGVEV